MTAPNFFSRSGRRAAKEAADATAVKTDVEAPIVNAVGDTDKQPMQPIESNLTAEDHAESYAAHVDSSRSTTGSEQARHKKAALKEAVDAGVTYVKGKRK